MQPPQRASGTPNSGVSTIAERQRGSSRSISAPEKTAFIALIIISALVFFLTCPVVAAIVYTLLTVSIPTLIYLAITRLNCCAFSSSPSFVDVRVSSSRGVHGSRITAGLYGRGRASRGNNSDWGRGVSGSPTGSLRAHVGIDVKPSRLSGTPRQ